MNHFKVGDEVVRKPNTDTLVWKSFQKIFPGLVYTVISVTNNSITIGHENEAPFSCNNFDFARQRTLEEMI